MTRLVVALLLAMAGFASADIIKFPDCGATLQACIDAAKTGDTIALTADVTDGGPFEIKRSLTLESAPGFHFTLPEFKGVVVRGLEATGSSITLRRLTLRGSGVLVVQESAAPLSVTIDDLEVVGGNSLRAIRIEEANVKDIGPIQFAVTGSVFRMASTSPLNNGCSGITATLFRAAAVSGRIERNVIDVSGTTQGAGINVYSAIPSTVVDIVGNTVRGTNFHTGIEVSQQKAGTLVARLVGNVVSGQEGSGGHPGALNVVGEDGTSDVLVANNTLVGNHNALQLFTKDTMRAVVANNIVAANVPYGIGIDQKIRPTLVAHRNLVFGNGSDFVLPDDGLLVADPRFVPDGILRPLPDSPVRDAGATDVLPPDLATDLAGTPRVVGSAVDIGAFELPCPDGRLAVGSCDPTPPPPTCDVAACDDGDPCTADACGADGCVHASLDGFAGALCACERPASVACAGQTVPPAIGKRQAKACSLLAKASHAKTRAAARLVRRSVRAWESARQAAAGRRARRALAPACRDAFGADLADAGNRTRSLTPARAGSR